MDRLEAPSGLEAISTGQDFGPRQGISEMERFILTQAGHPPPSYSVNVIGETTNVFTQELIRQFPAFKFSGERADFSAWQDQWEDYVQLVRQLSGENLTPYVLLSLLREKLDLVTSKEVSLRMRDPQAKYDEIYADICRRFGSEVGVNRNRWKKVKLARTGQGVSPAEWRRFRVELLLAIAQGYGEDEAAVREHVLRQLPESWRLAVVKQEMRRKANSSMVRVWIPPGEEAEQLFEELAYEVEGLGRFEIEGRSIRIDCRNWDTQARMLELNGCYVQMDHGQHQLKICVSDPQCSVEELCGIVDERVEELEEMRALSGEVAFAPVQVVEKEVVQQPPQDRGRGKERVTQGDSGWDHGKGEKGRQWSRGRSSSRVPSGSAANSYKSCGVCESLGRDSTHDYWQCKIAQTKCNGPFCGYCGLRGWECSHTFADCQKRLEQRK